MLELSVNMRISLLLALSTPQDREIINRKMGIPLCTALASAWSPSKLARCRKLLAAGSQPPPIHATRYLLRDEMWYVVGDGNHRTVAAQEANQHAIVAIVGAQVTCRPDAYRIDVARRVLWRCAGAASGSRRADNLEADFVTALRTVGVAVAPLPQNV